MGKGDEKEGGLGGLCFIARGERTPFNCCRRAVPSQLSRGTLFLERTSSTSQPAIFTLRRLRGGRIRFTSRPQRKQGVHDVSPSLPRNDGRNPPDPRCTKPISGGDEQSPLVPPRDWMLTQRGCVGADLCLTVLYYKAGRTQHNHSAPPGTRGMRKRRGKRSS